eukprot:CAMPEP_0119554670 /NCGR_PEP_ID=MMETSP1352-20130426/7080_1 /TAXON_ID=265584 /ORGANISM="Stauroneis constricta, Strain CCMP1120" /LENGTH=183 /DNA_ID=CAMNT_0007601285 /DNA_START=60 /DNA_END=611 /DNA_ORIENTATION=-
MASIIWTSIFVFLICELLLTGLLVIPVPRKIRNFIASKIFQLQLGEKLSKYILFIGIGLVFAILESFISHQRIVDRMSEYGDGGGYDHHHHGHKEHIHDKERKYKTERNMYLAGFAFTLLFVIGRITQLMEESVELEKQIHDLSAVTDPSKTNDVGAVDGDNGGGSIELKPMKKKPLEDKKKD